MSSSAAFCMGLLECFQNTFNSKLKNPSRTAQTVEHLYANTPCGLMDQTVIFEGKKNHFLKLHFEEDISVSRILLNNSLEKYRLVAINSGIRHKLGDSPYVERRNQCHKALQILNNFFHRKEKYLGNYAQEELFQSCFAMHPLAAQQDRLSRHLEDKMFSTAKDRAKLAKRSAHVIMECLRVKDMENALSTGAIETIDRLLIEGHNSLSGYFEVSTTEIDIIQEETRIAAQKLESTRSLDTLPILGPRLTGGGFGGSLVTMVHESILDSWIDKVEQLRSLQNLKTKIDIIVCQAVDGIKAMREQL